MSASNSIVANVSRGFALPTILIASFVMLVVLTSTLSSLVSGTIVSLDANHYNRYAKTASESGLAMARSCLIASNYETTWTNAKPLRPNTNCSGTVLSGVSQYVYSDSEIRSSFSVPEPTLLANGVQRVSVNGTSERLRTSSGQPWRTYADSTYSTISGQSSFNSVTFGYATGGAFFGVIDPLGAVSAVGWNGLGQLGNGTTTDSATPRAYTLPAGARGKQLFSNFLSLGNNLFAITTDGRVYGAGANDMGQLGNGAMATTQSTPVQFALPTGVTAQYISPGRNFVFVIGSDNNIYSSGSCSRGILGYTYTIAGCANQSTRKRVALPTVNTANLNTLPVASSDWVQSTNIANDRDNVFVRMQGGAVYGWGANDMGQLGNGTNTDSATPVKYGTFGDSGQAQATQVAFDGDSIWVLDSNGDVWASGYNRWGELGTSTGVRSATGLCFDNPGNGTVQAQARLYTCNDSTAQMMQFDPDGSIKFWPNPNAVLCLDNYTGSSANGNPIYVHPCNSTAPQQWRYRDDGSIYNPVTNKCVDNPGNSAASPTNLQLYDCNGSAAQQFTLVNSKAPQRVWRPAGQGKVIRITTDQWTTFFLMENGTVWGVGRNERGQLAVGSANNYNPYPRQIPLPSGLKAVDFYTTATGDSSGTNNYIANTYVVLSNGTVYGAGTNTYGQLGNGTTSAFSASLVKMNLPSGIVAQSVQSGFGTTVVLTDEGRIYTVGNNGNGQLGDGTTTNSATPVARQYVNTRPLLVY